METEIVHDLLYAKFGKTVICIEKKTVKNFHFAGEMMKRQRRNLFMSMISVSNLTFAYEGSYDNVFENVSFQIDTNWKLGFIGRNGRGKTTFLNLLMGKYAYSGTIMSK